MHIAAFIRRPGNMIPGVFNCRRKSDLINRRQSYIVSARFEREEQRQWDYLLDFYNLLVAYGGGGLGYPKPQFEEEIDKDQIDDYQIEFELCEDNYHIRGYVVDSDGKRIGKL